MSDPNDLAAPIRANVAAALAEDLRALSPSLSHVREAGAANSDVVTSNADLTAGLIPEHLQAHATLITRQAAVLCGTQWFEACFFNLHPGCKINWSVQEGERVQSGQQLCEVQGNARAMLTAERSALNFLQTLSGTATLVRRYVEAVAGINVKIMDTRKTLPGLRIAQKYAVRIGGGHNQRIGLFDGVLIKENHIAAAGGIGAVLEHAFRTTPPQLPIQIEVETLQQLEEALNAGAKLILLDNFSLPDMRSAVAQTAKRAELEASGNVSLDNVRSVAETGVNRISIGALTKDVVAVDLSMRFAL